jgi:DNA-binding beta-propeller fold protein YncE
VIGIPGSAYFGPAIDTGDFYIVAVCSELQYAIVLSSDRKGIHIISFSGAAPGHTTFVGELNSEPELVSLSPSGNTAAVLRGSSNAVDVLTGLPHNPVLKTVTIPAGVTAIAVADDAEALAVVEHANAISIIGKEWSRQLATAEDVRDITFRPNAHDLVYVDRGAGQVVMVSAASTEPVTKIIAGAADGISSPRNPVFLRNGRLAVANAGAGEILLVDPDSRVTRVPAPCSIAGLERMKEESAIRLICDSDEVMRILHVTENDPRVLFIPEPVE